MNWLLAMHITAECSLLLAMFVAIRNMRALTTDLELVHWLVDAAHAFGPVAAFEGRERGANFIRFDWRRAVLLDLKHTAEQGPSMVEELQLWQLGDAASVQLVHYSPPVQATDLPQ